jgi:hypothetical protein
MGAVPLATCWLWRLVFATSFRAGAASLSRRAAPLLLLTDCLYGSVLSAGIIFTILAVSSLREHLRAVRARAASRALRSVPRAALCPRNNKPHGPRSAEICSRLRCFVLCR